MTANDAERIRLTGYFGVEDFDLICATYRKHGSTPGSPWEAFRHAHLRLPDWFRLGLDPLSEPYAEQQHRLWRLMAGVDRPYDPATDEKEAPWGDIDPVREPGFFRRRDPLAVESASDHLIATGMLLKHCGLRPGDAALEYGAGFAQSALTLARLGVRVDTVDISPTFCDFVRRQAEFFQVPLTPFVGAFGINPRAGQKYRAIWFYESFHHCVDFRSVVRKLPDLLEAGGRVILGGEPIVEQEYAAVPYPWGVRLHSEVLAVMRSMHWFELGFSEAFLYELFVNAGFVGRRIDCPPTLFGRLYVFEARPDEIDFGSQWLPAALAERWSGAGEEGWGIAQASALPVDAGSGFGALELEVANTGPRMHFVEIRYGQHRSTHELAAGQRLTFRLLADPTMRWLEIHQAPRAPAMLRRLRAGSKGRPELLLKKLRYLRGA